MPHHSTIYTSLSSMTCINYGDLARSEPLAQVARFIYAPGLLVPTWIQTLPGQAYCLDRPFSVLIDNPPSGVAIIPLTYDFHIQIIFPSNTLKSPLNTQTSSYLIHSPFTNILSLVSLLYFSIFDALFIHKYITPTQTHTHTM